MKKAIDRYLHELQKDAAWRKPQNGSTFFNSGYVDYLDSNYHNKGEQENAKDNNDDSTGSGKQLGTYV